MLANLITSIVLSIGFGVSSLYVHNIKTIREDDPNQLYESSIGLTNYNDARNIVINNERIYLDTSLDFNNSNVIYQLPCYFDVSSQGLSADTPLVVSVWNNSLNDWGDSTTAWFEYDDENLIYYFKIRQRVGSLPTIKTIYSLNAYNDYYFNSQFSGLKLYVDTSSISDYTSYDFFTFYLSEYRFKGSLYNFSNSNPIHLFSTAILNNYFGFSAVHGIKRMFKGWFKHNGIYYNEINATLIDAQGTKYYNGQLVGSSSNLKVITSTPNTYIMFLNISYVNTIENYTYFALIPVYYSFDDTISTYVDISQYGWTDNKDVEFLSISIYGSPQGKIELNNLGYFGFVTHQNDLIASISYDNNYTWLNNTFSLISLCVNGMTSFLNIQILPFVNLGTLIFLPLIFVIVLAVVKLFKR